MIKALIIIALFLAAAYCIEKILGRNLLVTAIQLPVEYCTGYRTAVTGQGFYNFIEADDFSQKLQPLFSAVTCINLYCDANGWQYAEYELEAGSSDSTDGIRQAIIIEARNFFRMAHGVDNPDIIVPVLTENFLSIQIACSPKAHELAQTMNFTKLPKRKGSIDETIE
jgi:hypothetical protein